MRTFAVCASSVAVAVAVLWPTAARAVSPARGQPPALRVKVVDDGSQQPLPNAELMDLGSGAHRFTNDRGEAVLPWPGDGRLRLRVRQLGFQFVDRTLVRDANASPASDTITVALRRVAYALPQVFSNTRCGSDTDPASRLLSASVLEQLRAGAERYKEFRLAYPFHVRQERRTGTIGTDGKIRSFRRGSEEVDSEDWGDPYQPGEVVQRTGLRFTVPILFIATLADALFWDRHCFVARGVESLNGARVVRLEFSRAADLRSADWEGAALVDSATSLLRRVDFRLAGLTDDESPHRFEGYTTFTTPSPFIVVPDSTIAIWWRRAVTDGQWGSPDVAQSISVKQLRYRKAAPPVSP